MFLSRFSYEFYLSLVLNVLCGLPKLNGIDSLCKSKGAQALATASRCRTQVDKHERFAVPTEAVLKKVGELRVPIRNVTCALRQRREDISERTETLIDGLCLLESLGIVACTAAIQALATGEVAQAQGSFDFGLAVVIEPTNVKLEYGMASGTLSIHVGAGNGASTGSNGHQCLQL